MHSGSGKSGSVAEFIPRGIFYNGCLYSSTAFNEPLPIWAGDKRGRLPDGVTAWQAGRHVEGAGEGGRDRNRQDDATLGRNEMSKH